MKSQAVLFRNFLSKYRFEGVSFHFRIEVCLKCCGFLEKRFCFLVSPPPRPSSGNLDIPALNHWQRISFSVWSFSNQVLFISFHACILVVSLPCGSCLSYRKEQVKQTTPLLKISFLSCSKVLRTNLKMCLKSQKWGREHICCISSTSRHAWGLFFSGFLATLGLLK